MTVTAFLDCYPSGKWQTIVALWFISYQSYLCVIKISVVVLYMANSDAVYRRTLEEKIVIHLFLNILLSS